MNVVFINPAQGSKIRPGLNRRSGARGVRQGHGKRGPARPQFRQVVQAAAGGDGSGFAGHPVPLQRSGQEGSELKVEAARLTTGNGDQIRAAGTCAAGQRSRQSQGESCGKPAPQDHPP